MNTGSVDFNNKKTHFIQRRSPRFFRQSVKLTFLKIEGDTTWKIQLINNFYSNISNRKKNKNYLIWIISIDNII